MRCCGLRPQARRRASLPPPPPPLRRNSFQYRLSQLLKKSSLPSLPPSPSFASPASHLSPLPLPPSPPASRPLLRFLLPSPTPPRLLQNLDGVDLPSTLLLPASPSSRQTHKIDALPPAESAFAPIPGAEQKIAGSLSPLVVDAKSNSASGDPSSDAKVAGARKERSCGWAFVPDRAVVNVATRIAFLGATTGAVLVGKVALAGATMTVTVACSALQLISRAWDSSSGKVTPLPPPDPLPSVGISDSLTPRPISSSIIETVETSSCSSKTPPNQAANSSSSPRCLKRLEDKQEDRPLVPIISAHAVDLVRAVGDRPSSPLKSPPPTLLNQASRMGNSLENQHSMKPSQDLRQQKAEHSDVDLSRAEQQQSYSLGFFLATIGLLIGLSGLFGGRVLGVLVVVCWWYVIPSLRKTAGEKQTAVRMDLEEAEKADLKGKKRNSSSTLSTPERLPSDYRKRVIMEGILERDRRPTTG